MLIQSNYKLSMSACMAVCDYICVMCNGYARVNPCKQKRPFPPLFSLNQNITMILYCSLHKLNIYDTQKKGPLVRTKQLALATILTSRLARLSGAGSISLLRLSDNVKYVMTHFTHPFAFTCTDRL